MRNKKIILSTFMLSFFFTYGGNGIVYPYLSLILQGKGFTPSAIGYILGGVELFGILGLLLIGYLFDKLRVPRVSILLTLLLCTISLALITLPDSPILVIIGTLLLGFFYKSPGPLVDAHFSQSIEGSEAFYGKVRWAGSFGFFTIALGVQLSGFIKSSYPITILFSAGLLYSLAGLMALFFPPTLKDKKSKSHCHTPFIEAIKEFPPIYWLGLFIAFLSFVGMAGHYSFFSLMIKDRFHTEKIGAMWAIGPLGEVPIFFFAAHLIRRFKLKQIWSICLLAGVLRLLVYAKAQTLIPLYFIQIMHSFSFGLNHTCMMTLIQRKTKPKNRGVAMTIYAALTQGMGVLSGGVLGGWILSFTNFTNLFLIFAIFPLLGFIINLLFMKE